MLRAAKFSDTRMKWNKINLRKRYFAVMKNFVFHESRLWVSQDAKTLVTARGTQA
jgi:hypothetical protein